jgi:hypothetical protein
MAFFSSEIVGLTVSRVLHVFLCLYREGNLRVLQTRLVLLGYTGHNSDNAKIKKNMCYAESVVPVRAISQVIHISHSDQLGQLAVSQS